MTATAHEPARVTPGVGRTPWIMLAMATTGFALNFWAWALLSPLGPMFAEDLGLSAFQQSMVVALPVLVGSVGRIPVGALTDRFGGKVMFPVVSIATLVPVLYIGLLGHTSLAALLIGGLFLGIGGTAFAIGVPVVNKWFPPEKRGLAIGIFGAGMGGTAISALTTVPLVDAGGVPVPFILTAIALAGFAVVAALWFRDAPSAEASAESLLRRMAVVVRLPITWYASMLYALAFGGYVAFSVYLPTYLRNGYELTQIDAANRMAGFVLLAVIARPLGGWLSDRFGPERVLAVSLLVVAGGATVQSFAPELMPLGTIMFLAMATALGAATGATFALIALLTPAHRVGAVTGFVGAAGGLGGFVPPLLMGGNYEMVGTYAVSLLALAVVTTAAAITVRTVTRDRITRAVV